jgi:hypothetical protein
MDMAITSLRFKYLTRKIDEWIFKWFCSVANYPRNFSAAANSGLRVNNKAT